MKRIGEIIIIEDDEDDRMFLQDIFASLDYPNKVVFFEDPTQVVPYLSNSDAHSFMILSDINMPKISGFDLHEKIISDPRISSRCIPYIFLSTSGSLENVERAFKHSIQGFFQKQSDFAVYKEMIKSIMEYWRMSLVPQRLL